MEKGFVIIDRRIEDWKWWGNLTAMGIWLYIIEKCNWNDGWWHGMKVERGSFITSKLKMSEELKVNRRTIDHWLKVFEDDGQISVTCTSRYTKITALNYGKYQSSTCVDAQLTAQPTTQPTAHNRTRITSKQQLGGGIEEDTQAKFDLYYQRALDTYLGREDEVERAYTKLWEIMANLPAGDARKVTPNIPEACLYADKFWLDHDWGDVENPEGYIRKILVKNKRRKREDGK